MKILKRVGYCRISTDLQNIEVQKLQLSEIGITEFKTEIISTSKKLVDRKFYKLIHEVEEGTEIVVVALDRIARNTMETLQIVEIIKERNLILKTIRENLVIETDMKPETTMLLTVLGSIAEMERKTIQNRVKKGMAMAKKNGKQIGRKKGGKNSKNMFDKNRFEIEEYLHKNITINSIIKLLGYGTRQSLSKYIKKNILNKNMGEI